MEICRHTSIHTTSPVENSFFSSWAWYFFERRMVFFITGWVKRRSTRTTTVLSCLSLTTTPWRVRLGIALYSALAFERVARLGFAARLLAGAAVAAPDAGVGCAARFCPAMVLSRA